MTMSPEFTVCVLLYGDFPDLAVRCLGPRLLALGDRIELRVALNAVGKSTEKFVHGLRDSGRIQHLYASAENRFKYPVMRQMFYDPLAPITTPYVMWFDDDSYLKDNGQTPHAWLDNVSTMMRDADMLGSKYTLSLYGNQHLWVQSQPWYKADPVIEKGAKITFLTGGWWTIRYEVLQRFNWPIPELRHRGGDSMLGCLLTQQKLRLRHFRDGVAINANAQGKESASPRRGYDEHPIGVTYRPEEPQHLASRPRPKPRLDLEL